MSFEIDPRDCLLILTLHETGSIRLASRTLGKDPSVLLRQLQRLAASHGLAEKVDGTWRATQRGAQLAVWAKEAALAQRTALRAPLTLRLGANATFLERVLLPALAGKALAAIRAGSRLEILCPPEGLEPAILRGTLDIAFACGRPHDPLIRFRKIAKESWVLVAAPAVAQKVLREPPARRLERLLQFTHLRHRQLVVGDFLPLSDRVLGEEIAFDLASSVRAASVAGLGWALLPYTVVREELRAKSLVDLAGGLGLELKQDFLGIWWLNSNRFAGEKIAPLAQWLESERL